MFYAGKTGSVIATSRGRRKLDFDTQRFKGKTMFLDLAGYRRISEIEYELTERGGVDFGSVLESEIKQNWKYGAVYTKSSLKWKKFRV